MLQVGFLYTASNYKPSKIQSIPPKIHTKINKQFLN